MSKLAAQHPASERHQLDSVPRRSRWRTIACFMLMLAALQIVLGPKIRLSQWALSADENAGVKEGVAWLNGRLDLADQGPDPAHKRMHDTAYFNGKVYNVFPPLIGFLTVILAPLHQLLLGHVDFWLQSPMLLLLYWPLPVAGFVVFRKQTGDAAWAALLTVAWMGGTSLLPCLAYTRTSHLGPLYHVTSQVGLLIFAADLMGKRRIWPSLIGLAISIWSRQLTCLYALPLLIVAYKQKRLALAILGLSFIASPLMLLNHYKFGSAFDFGYKYIYVGREADPIAQRALNHGVFSPDFILENLWYTFLAPPRVEDISIGLIQVEPTSLMGTGLLVTTPLIWLTVISLREWWRDGQRRLLMLSTLPVIAGLSMYHSPGFLQYGFCRFSLDFLPIWLAVIAPWTRGGWRTWFTLSCTALSLLYFQAVVPTVVQLVSTGVSP